jgi:16S rRNA (cytosine1402-N4)-methyltransferase
MARLETVTTPHASVMLNEAIEALNITPEGDYVDATFGRGGHSRVIASMLSSGRLLVIDKDPEAITSANALKDSGLPIEVYHGSFKDIQEALEEHGFGLVDGILFDLGVSSPQLDNPERGFSFMRNGPLDMRMDTTKGITAADWISQTDEADIAHALKVYGEERFAGRIARKIVEVRTTTPITTTQALVDVIEKAIPFKEKNKHFATRTFQAVRMVVNQELEDVKIALTGAINALKSGGRLVVLSFHSLEDRLVKQTLKAASMGEEPKGIIPYKGDRPKGILKLLGKMKATEAEVSLNARSRSAILRVAEKC